jgi:hypothetical protein
MIRPVPKNKSPKVEIRHRNCELHQEGFQRLNKSDSKHEGQGVVDE